MAAKRKGTLNIILVGKTGSGKSSSGNTMLQKKVYDTSSDFGSATSVCSLQGGTFHDWDLNVMDTPGLFDTEQNPEETGVIIVQAIINMHTGFDAVLYVIRHGSRYTEEEFSAYKRFKMLFGSDITSHMIILFTGGDNLEPGTDFNQKLRKAPKNLQNLLEDTNWRYVIFNNKAPGNQEQLQQLFNKVEEIRAQNKSRPYVCSSYSKIGDTVEAQVGKRIREIEEQEARNNKYFQEKEQEFLKRQEKMNLSEQERENEMAAFQESKKLEIQRLTSEWEEKLRREREEQERKHELEMQSLEARQQSPAHKLIPSGDAVLHLLEKALTIGKDCAIAFGKK